MKIKVTTKTGNEIDGTLSTKTKYIISVDVDNLDAVKANELTHLDDVDITTFRSHVNVIVDIDKVQSYTIY